MVREAKKIHSFNGFLSLQLRLRFELGLSVRDVFRIQLSRSRPRPRAPKPAEEVLTSPQKIPTKSEFSKNPDPQTKRSPKLKNYQFQSKMDRPSSSMRDRLVFKA